MYPNLEAEMARAKLTNVDCAALIGISEKSYSNKRCGKSEFTLGEIKKLQKKLFPKCSLEYLFSEVAITSVKR